RRLVEVLDDDDLRPGLVGDVTAIRTYIGRRLVRFIARLDNERDGVPGDGPHLRHEVAELFVVEGGSRDVVPGDLFPAVVDGGRVPALQLEQVGVAEALGGHNRFLE